MLAQIERHQQKKLVLFSTQHSPETISTLFEKIGHEQLVLHTLLSKELILPDNQNTVSLRIFLAEIQDRLRLFMLTFDEISVQMPSNNRENMGRTFNSTLQRANLLDASDAITKVLSLTKELSELFMLLKIHLQNTDSPVFLKALICKSLIFYKQTNVVLTGYLRIYKVNGDNR